MSFCFAHLPSLKCKPNCSAFAFTHSTDIDLVKPSAGWPSASVVHNPTLLTLPRDLWNWFYTCLCSPNVMLSQRVCTVKSAPSYVKEQILTSCAYRVPVQVRARGCVRYGVRDCALVCDCKCVRHAVQRKSAPLCQKVGTDTQKNVGHEIVATMRHEDDGDAPPRRRPRVCYGAYYGVLSTLYSCQ